MAAGCSKPPDEVQTFRTPLAGLTLTYETWNNGPLVSDTNSLIAHFVQKDKKEISKRILDGDYLVFSKFFWASPRRLVLCYRKGTVYNFTNEVDFLGDGTRSFHISLKEDC
jgi:hypothetical protein